MTDQEINIAVAELCGADEILECTGGFAASAYWPESWRAKLERLSQTVSRSDERPGKIVSAVPKFSSDLPAIQIVINSLTESERYLWLAQMDKITLRRSKEWFPARIATSTAHEWSESYLRVRGKWKEGA